MKARFCCAKNQAFIFLSKLIPKNIVNTTNEEITKIVQNIINHFKFDDAKWMNIEEIELKTEIDLWKLKWTRIQNEGGEIHTDVITSAEACNEVVYPTIRELLFIISCLPVSVASAERSFSTLRRLKTWLRSRIGQNRLTGLALLHFTGILSYPLMI
ncbi:hypothetical protein ACI65C_013243 [Semiaphis heraclei]